MKALIPMVALSSTPRKMKRISAIIRPSKLQVVTEALSDIAHPSVTVTEVKGRG